MDVLTLNVCAVCDEWYTDNTPLSDCHLLCFSLNLILFLGSSHVFLIYNVHCCVLSCFSLFSYFLFLSLFQFSIYCSFLIFVYILELVLTFDQNISMLLQYLDHLLLWRMRNIRCIFFGKSNLILTTISCNWKIFTSNLERVLSLPFTETVEIWFKVKHSKTLNILKSKYNWIFWRICIRHSTIIVLTIETSSQF